jgi:hypothetical protein
VPITNPTVPKSKEKQVYLIDGVIESPKDLLQKQYG